MPPVAAGALKGVNAPVRGRWASVATPVHLTAGMTSVSMPRDGILTLEPDEAGALAADFNEVFAGSGVRMAVGRAATLMCLFDEALEVETHDPESVLGHDVFEQQPAGVHGPRLRRLMSEIELWLFDHPKNRARRAHGRSAITGLWLWGGAEIGTAVPAVHGWTAGQDAFFSAFGAAIRWPTEGGNGVVACAFEPGSVEWEAIESGWLSPAAAALRSRRIQRLELSAAGVRISVMPGLNLRFWRRPRPWWESFETVPRSDDE